MDIINENEKIDEEKIKIIRKKIYSREVQKSKKFKAKKDSEMVAEIKNIIEREVEKCY